VTRLLEHVDEPFAMPADRDTLAGVDLFDVTK
jgi:hypothetical protein